MLYLSVAFLYNLPRGILRKKELHNWEKLLEKVGSGLEFSCVKEIYLPNQGGKNTKKSEKRLRDSKGSDKLLGASSVIKLSL